MPLTRRQLYWGVIIPSGASTPADNVNAKGMAFGSMAMPSSLTSTTCTFQVDLGDGNLRTVKDAFGSVVSVTVGTLLAVRIPDEVFPCDSFKPVLGSAEGAERTIPCLLSG
jgi:hypothetical protein